MVGKIDHDRGIIFEEIRHQVFSQPEVLDVLKATWLNNILDQDGLKMANVDPDDVDRRFAFSVKNWIKRAYISPMKAGSSERAPRLFSLEHVYQVMLLRLMIYQNRWPADLAVGLASESVKWLFVENGVTGGRLGPKFLCFIHKKDDVDEDGNGNFLPVFVVEGSLEGLAETAIITCTLQMTLFDEIDRQLHLAIKNRDRGAE